MAASDTPVCSDATLPMHHDNLSTSVKTTCYDECTPAIHQYAPAIHQCAPAIHQCAPSTRYAAPMIELALSKKPRICIAPSMHIVDNDRRHMPTQAYIVVTYKHTSTPRVCSVKSTFDPRTTLLARSIWICLALSTHTPTTIDAIRQIGVYRRHLALSKEHSDMHCTEHALTDNNRRRMPT